jgi:hypothetical protein
VRTKTSALRAHELVHVVFGSDPRIRVVYVFDAGSRINGWLTIWEVDQEVQVLSWQEGLKVDHDLVITFSENIDYSQLSGPIFLFPHGLGNNKWIPSPSGDDFSLSGLPPPKVLRKVLKAGRLTFVVTHPDQARQLAAAVGAAIPFLVAGDISFAILRASLEPRHVERYRRHLGTGLRRLVLVSSTWGAGAILGACPELLDHLLAQLPMDSYQIACIAHCNVWDRDGPDELRRKLQRQLQAGLVLVPPKYWHSAVASANVAIVDHGSIGLYAVAAGKPVILGAFSKTEVVAGTSMAKLGVVAPRLSLTIPVLPLIETATTSHDSGLAAHFTNMLFKYPDDGGQIIQHHLYAHLGLTPHGG